MAVRPEKHVVFRKRCPGCKTGFTLLPNDVVPLHSYGLQLVAARLLASVSGQAARSRKFYEQHSLLPDEIRGDHGSRRGQSWSDLLNDKALRPSHQLFGCWRRKWVARAQAWLYALLIASTHAGCDLKTRFGESLQGFQQCPVDLRALALAAGLVGLLQEQCPGDSFRSTIFLLACSASHKICRAAGRPPPHYVGDLQFCAGVH